MQIPKVTTVALLCTKRIARNSCYLQRTYSNYEAAKRTDVITIICQYFELNSLSFSVLQPPPPGQSAEDVAVARSGLSSVLEGSTTRQSHNFRSRKFVNRVKKLSAGDWQGVLRVLDEAENAEMRIASDSASSGEVSGTVGVTTYMYASCISRVAKCGPASEALETLDRVRLAGVEPNVFCINAALNAHVKAGQWRQALQLLRKCRHWISHLISSATDRPA